MNNRRRRDSSPTGLLSLFDGRVANARMRLSLIAGLSLVTLLIYIIHIPLGDADFLIDAGLLGNLLILAIAIWGGLQIAALVQTNLFGLEAANEARQRILGRAFGIGLPMLEIGRESGMRQIIRDLDKVGGPAHLLVSMDSALVVESSAGQLRAIGPSGKLQILESYERIRALVDLRDQVVGVNLSARTQDGVRISVEGARLVYSIARGKEEPSLGRPYPFSKQAALRLVRFGNSNKSQAQRYNDDLARPVGEQGQEFFERELQRFIGKIWMSEFLSQEGNTEVGEAGGPSLLLAREKIRNQFVEAIRGPAIELGLELHWIDIGAWKTDELAQEILEDYQQGLIDNIPYSGKEIAAEHRSEELNRLFAELLPEDFEQELRSDSKAASTKMLAGFFGLLDGLRLRYGMLMDEDEERLEVLLRFLRVLSKRAEKEV